MVFGLYQLLSLVSSGLHIKQYIWCMISIPYGKLLYLQAACQRECPKKLFLRPNMRQDFKIQLKVTICSCLVRFKTIIEECLTWGRHEKGGRFIYSEIEIGRVSAFEVKQHHFAGTVALQNEQVARGGSLEDASNLSPTLQLRAHGSCQLQKPTLGPRNLFSCYWREHWGEGRKGAAEWKQMPF